MQVLDKDGQIAYNVLLTVITSSFDLGVLSWIIPGLFVLGVCACIAFMFSRRQNVRQMDKIRKKS